MRISNHSWVFASVHLLVIFLFSCLSAIGQDKEPAEKLTEADLAFCAKNDLTRYAKASEKWKAEATKLSRGNASEGSPDAILCLGSSSFRLWNTIGDDLAPYKMLRRAYGGAKYCDLAIHSPQLIHGLDYKAVLIFVGNDITGSELDKTPEEIVRLSSIVISTIRSHKPNVPIFLVAVTPTPSRFKHWSRIQQANRSLETMAKSQSNVFFVRTEDKYLTDKNEPRPELFGKDMLHQNADGYKLWASIIRKSLDANLK
ncbi:MAG: GDSL-type esterase/lipase family protein [Pirellula sp.]